MLLPVRLLAVFSAFLSLLLKEAKTRPTIFRDIMGPLNHRMDGADRRNLRLPRDYPPPSTACSDGTEFWGNSFDGRNAGVWIYYSQKLSVPVSLHAGGQPNLTHLLLIIKNYVQSCIPARFAVSKEKVTVYHLINKGSHLITGSLSLKVLCYVRNHKYVRKKTHKKLINRISFFLLKGRYNWNAFKIRTVAFIMFMKDAIKYSIF